MTMRYTPARALRLVERGDGKGGRLRVAFATSAAHTVDAPFGKATEFAIYEVAAGTSRLVGRIEFEPTLETCAAANDNPDDCASRIDARIAALAGCHVLFAAAIGDGAAARAIRCNIHPLVVVGNQPISALLRRCQTMLTTNPPPWVRRVLDEKAREAASGRNGTECEPEVLNGANGEPCRHVSGAAQ